MAWSKSVVNFVFAAIVVLLGTTSGIFLYVNSNPTHNSRTESAGQSGSGMQGGSSTEDVARKAAVLEQLIAGDPQNPEYRTELGNLYFDAGQYDKAQDWYQQSLSIRPRDPNVETDLATCFHYLGHDEKALELFDKVLSYSPGFSQAMFNKGIVLIGKRDYKGAIAVWEDLLRSNPNFPQKAELEQRIQQLRASGQ